MMRPALLLALVVAHPLLAQSGGKTAKPAGSSGADSREAWTQVTTYLTRAASAVPDSSYGYKPVATVRSFGQLIAHVADAQRMFCATVLGESAPKEGELEKTLTSKADLVKALDESTRYCTRAYEGPQARFAGTVEFFGKPRSKASLLVMNVMHDYEHYGNIVTYMRMLGMVPPSSQANQ